MNLTITLPRELGVQVEEAAARQGWNADEYVINVIKRELKKPSLDELLAPIRQQFAASGLTEEELTALVKEERRALWRARHGERQE